MSLFGHFERNSSNRGRAELFKKHSGASFGIDLTAAYPADAELERYVRTARMDGETVTVTDSYRLKSDKGDAVFHFMTVKKPVLVERGVILLDCGMRMLYDPALEAGIEEIVPDGLNAKGNWDTDLLYRILFTSRCTDATYTFTVRPTENT